MPDPRFDRTIDIALIGLGNVGRSLVRYLVQKGEYRGTRFRVRMVADTSGAVLIEDQGSIGAVLEAKNSGRRLRELGEFPLLSAPLEMPAQMRHHGIRVLVEALPTNVKNGEPALSILRSALESGVSVVTVDKGPLVHGFHELCEAARIGKSRIAYTGTMGVAPPDHLVSGEVAEIRGILNGTTNFILSVMQSESLPFDSALRRAQELGIAEPDPSMDIEGWDSACKMLILARRLMNCEARLDEVSRTGIGPGSESLLRTARASGRVLRLLGRARIWEGKVRVSVAPKLVGLDSPFFSVSGSAKAAVFTTRDGIETIVHGRSGRDMISETILEDVLHVSGESGAGTPGERLP